MNIKYLNLYNNLIRLTRNKSLYKKSDNTETFSDRLTIFLLHFAFFLKNYKNNSSKKELQDLYDFVFRQIELSVREIGYGDASINKRMKEYVNYMHSIIKNIESWEILTLNEKLVFFKNYINLDKESSFYVDYFEKYTVYLSKKTFNYFTKDVISLKF
jgi:Uncharacterized conserved protein